MRWSHRWSHRPLSFVIHLLITMLQLICSKTKVLQLRNNADRDDQARRKLHVILKTSLSDTGINNSHNQVINLGRLPTFTQLLAGSGTQSSSSGQEGIGSCISSQQSGTRQTRPICIMFDHLAAKVEFIKLVCQAKLQRHNPPIFVSDDLTIGRL